MTLDPKFVEKPFHKLGKLLKKFPDPPAAEDVHKVRTYARRIEAVADAFELHKKKAGRNLLKGLKLIRKAAGVVRDMDVLIDLLASLDPETDSDCRTRLTEHLAVRRQKAAAKLLKKIDDQQKTVRESIKHCVKSADVGLDTSANSSKSDKRKSMHKSAGSIALSFEIEQDLRDWPKLTASNIHQFRLKTKELRNVLQLAQDRDSKFVAALGSVKNQVGLWHDWNELQGIAAKVLDHGSRCPLAVQIRARTKDELQKALQVANDLRRQYLRRDARGRKKGVAADLHPAVLKAASRLAS